MHALLAPARDLPLMSTAEFAAFENTRPDSEKWQLIKGALFMMTDGTIRHAHIIGNIHSALRARLKGGPCRTYMSDAKVANAEVDFSAYPDVVVSCATPPLDLELEMSDPTAIFEVLSPSTQHLDRGDKLFAYQQIARLNFCALVYTDELRVEVWSRGAEGFSEKVYKRAGESVHIDALSVEIPLGDIFEGVALVD